MYVNGDRRYKITSGYSNRLAGVSEATSHRLRPRRKKPQQSDHTEQASVHVVSQLVRWVCKHWLLQKIGPKVLLNTSLKRCFTLCEPDDCSACLVLEEVCLLGQDTRTSDPCSTL
jgi:hypothetical protein